MIRVVLPYQLRTLAKVTGEVALEVPPPVTQRALLDALEERYPALRGAIRDLGPHKRRPMIRFFACEDDYSNESPDAPLPAAAVEGREAFWVVGALAGGSA
ncbi:MAG TPA: MoaD/ThiS family protein [Urbifossiella sp.]|nr:MoaD/ThiS family protein [Urbifossiella sp.]